MTRCALVVVAAAFAGTFSVVVAKEIEALSFAAPFNDILPSGDRTVGKFWRVLGSTTVHQNFVRLTPDRQSKKGALWSTRSLGAHEVSATVKFRISGQGKKYFGDGLALWLTDARSYRQGDFHGIGEKFKGVGVIFDTFKNAETLAFHKDITVVWNEGSTKIEEMLQASVGCNADVRYHEDRGDFTVDSSSRVKLVIEPMEASDTVETEAEMMKQRKGKKGKDKTSPEDFPPLKQRLVLRVFKDPANKHEWQDCVQSFLLPEALDLAWLTKAHIGVTSSTGQLADNHDLLALEVFSDDDAHLESEEVQKEERWFNLGEGVSEERFERIEDEIDNVISRLEHLQHHLEHEMVAVDDHVRTTIEKLQKQEKGAEDRIEALEKKVVNNVEDSLTKRIATLEDAMRDAVTKRIKTVETKYMSELEDVVGDKLKNAGSSWTAPFIFLILVDVVAAIAVYKWYVKFKKSHLL